MARNKLNEKVPNLNGKLVVVTGASDGLGLGLAECLAAAGAELVLPVRNRSKGVAAIERIQRSTRGAQVSLGDLDLSSQESVAKFTEGMRNDGRPIDILIMNAGLMAPSTRHATDDGFELQLATNYLGHFALTGGLFPLLVDGGARITTVSSVAARTGKILWDDMQSEKKYVPMRAYGQSKLAGMFFALELDRRSKREGWGITSNVAHPGLTSTNLQASGPNMGRAKKSSMDRLFKRLSASGSGRFVQQVATGMLPTLYAATSPDAGDGKFYGPDGFLHLTGHAAEQDIYRPARNEEEAARMWEVSEKLTHVEFPRETSAL